MDPAIHRAYFHNRRAGRFALFSMSPSCSLLKAAALRAGPRLAGLCRRAVQRRPSWLAGMLKILRQRRMCLSVSRVGPQDLGEPGQAFVPFAIALGPQPELPAR